jgi:hypothetical protein
MTDMFIMLPEYVRTTTVKSYRYCDKCSLSVIEDEFYFILIGL